MDQYIKDVIDGRHFLIVERAADEYIQAEKEILTESTTTVDSFVDGIIDGISQEDLDAIIDGDVSIDTHGDDVVDPIDFIDSPEMADVDAILDTTPEVMELDFDDPEID